MKARVLINGIAGRMGSMSTEAIKADNDLEFAGGVGSGDNLSMAYQSMRYDYPGLLRIRK